MAAAALRGGVRRFPWLCNVLLYAGLFAAGDAAQQLWRRRRRPGGGGGPPPDWAQTRRVALVALAFHGNFSYVWLRALERALPGRRPAAVLAKVLCDQLLGAPVAVLAFYTGMSILQKKEDIFSDCRKKFWNTYKTGLMYWPFVQEPAGRDRERDHASTAQSTPDVPMGVVLWALLLGLPSVNWAVLKLAFPVGLEIHRGTNCNLSVY
ncbi:mpv17-like protein isoform X6 [Apteryx mantelli]|uniref:Mpv17-like protein isoform X6 n=1 Tax=Apteryx mantelli TaxID=2696672 RepID=A0ABM4FBJ6_9AVES